MKRIIAISVMLVSLVQLQPGLPSLRKSTEIQS